MKKLLHILFLAILFLPFQIKGQSVKKIELKKADSYKCQIENLDSKGFNLTLSIPELIVKVKNTSQGDFLQINFDLLMKTFNAGYPDLPTFSKLIEVPLNADVKINVISYDEEIVSLNDYNLKELIIPAQPSQSKSDPDSQSKFHFNKEVYSTNAFFSNKIASFENSGIMRNIRLGRIEIAPLQYNPVTNQLKVLNNIVVKVEFGNSTKQASLDKYASPFFNTILSQMLGKKKEKALITNTPIKYVIVSDRMFEETLQTFIAWKKKKGFKVIEAYTDIIGKTKEEIRDYLKNLYLNPAEGENAPDFILFVGDVQEIPSFGRPYTCDAHVSDLYYCEYTGDYLPEVFYGRFSASSVAELEPQISKTLEYEMYLMPNPAYLDETILIAGVDKDWAPINGNGALNYISNNYINEENGITSYNYYYDNTSGLMASNNPDASASIIEKISQGVGFGNYTAHCSSSGWADPGFTTNNINGLQNAHEYAFLIGNCCLSNKFDDNDCFGERILQAVEKGAIGYIGASNSSLWDEDYWWGVGVTNTVVLNPTYEISGLGAYDRLLHTNGEEAQEWYITQGQISVAGNLAVEASTSQNKRYYWEIYHLMGDPSLMNYIGVPSEITYTTSPSIIYTGSNSFEITTTPYAYVALSKNGELLAVAHSNNAGQATLNFSYLLETNALDLVITAQNKQPYIGTIDVQYSQEPALVIDQFIIDDELENKNNQADYGETINIDLSFKNVTETGTANDLSNIIVTATCDDSNINMSEQTVNYTEILAGSPSDLADNAMELTVNNFIIDQYKAIINLAVTADHNGNPLTWNLQQELVLNAPVILLGTISIDDSQSGNLNGILDPGEEINMNVIVENTGHTDLNNAVLNFNDASGIITSSALPVAIGTIPAQQKVMVPILAKASDNAVIGSLTNLTFIVEGGITNEYTASKQKTIVIGDTPKIKMGEVSEYHSCYSLFLDSGGYDYYSNNENDTIILYSSEPGNFVSLNFQEFDVEGSEDGCYDKLYVYDGSNTSAELIGTYCNNNIPQTITAQNPTGALTVVFESDFADVKAGWEAMMTCINTNLATFDIQENGMPVENATVKITGYNILSDPNGIANFALENGTYSYTISAKGYNSKSGQFSITDEDKTINIELAKSIYSITFNIKNNTSENLDATVTLNGITKTANNGKVVFDNLTYKENVAYSVEMFCYTTINNELNIDNTKTISINMERVKTDVEFHIYYNEEALSNAIVKAGIYQTVANSEGIAKLTLPANTYEFTLEKTGYNKYTGSLLVEETAIIKEVYMYLLGIEDENINANSILIYPNPAKNLLNIQTKNFKAEAKISLTSLDGRVVFIEKLSIQPSNKIILPNLTSGMYILKIDSKEQNFSTTIVIQ